MLGESSVPGIRSRRHELVKGQIVNEAWALAEEAGIAGLSLRELARRVGMQAPSLYTYFGSKDEIYDAMFHQGYVQLGEAQAEWLTDIGGLSPEDALTYSLRAWMEFCRASIARYQIMFTRAIPGWEPSAEAYAASVAQYESMTAAFASIGIDDEETMRLLMALSAGLVSQQLANDPAGDEWAALAPAAARMLLERRRER
jgi:AcrR family transcriptional regulator